MLPFCPKFHGPPSMHLWEDAWGRAPSALINCPLDDNLCVVAVPDQVGATIAAIQELMRRDNIRVHLGNFKVWNAGALRPRACAVLQHVADAANSRAPVWRGFDPPTLEASWWWELLGSRRFCGGGTCCIPTRRLVMGTSGAGRAMCMDLVDSAAARASCGWFDCTVMARGVSLPHPERRPNLSLSVVWDSRARARDSLLAGRLGLIHWR